LPSAVVAHAYANALRAELRYNWAMAAGEDAPASALGKTINFAPLAERQDLIVFESGAHAQQPLALVFP